MQKVMTLTTAINSLRAQVQSWNLEDGDAVYLAWRKRRDTIDGCADQNSVPVGMIGGMTLTNVTWKYPTVLHAIGDGWTLMSPPAEKKTGDLTEYQWWLSRGQPTR